MRSSGPYAARSPWQEIPLRDTATVGIGSVVRAARCPRRSARSWSSNGDRSSHLMDPTNSRCRATGARSAPTMSISTSLVRVQYPPRAGAAGRESSGKLLASASRMRGSTARPRQDGQPRRMRLRAGQLSAAAEPLRQGEDLPSHAGFDPRRDDPGDRDHPVLLEVVVGEPDLLLRYPSRAIGKRTIGLTYGHLRPPVACEGEAPPHGPIPTPGRTSCRSRTARSPSSKEPG